MKAPFVVTLSISNFKSSPIIFGVKPERLVKLQHHFQEWHDIEKLVGRRPFFVVSGYVHQAQEVGWDGADNGIVAVVAVVDANGIFRSFVESY